MHTASMLDEGGKCRHASALLPVGTMPAAGNGGAHGTYDADADEAPRGLSSPNAPTVLEMLAGSAET